MRLHTFSTIKLLALASLALAGVAGLVGVGGCGAPFLHGPSLADAPAVRDDGLVGQWTMTGDTTTHATIVERPTGGNAYAVSLDVHYKGEFKAAVTLELVLTDIDGGRYADLFLARPERDKLVATYGLLVVPVHQVMRFQRTGDELRVWPFDGAWLERNASVGGEGGFSSDRLVIGGSETAVLTAPSGQVRAFIAKYGQDPRAFGDPFVFRRAK